jgi:hypothetical protein
MIPIDFNYGKVFLNTDGDKTIYSDIFMLSDRRVRANTARDGGKLKGSRTIAYTKREEIRWNYSFSINIDGVRDFMGIGWDSKDNTKVCS